MVEKALIITHVKSEGPDTLGDFLTSQNIDVTDAAHIASMVHYGHYTVGQIKSYLSGEGIPVRELV